MRFLILQRIKLDRVNLRSFPVTEALREQQERSLSFEAQWALDLADRGGVWFNATVQLPSWGVGSRNAQTWLCSTSAMEFRCRF
ncbi:MAG: hypothetical protein NVS3B5_05850 [Sphingomicrobium sp.]